MRVILVMIRSLWLTYSLSVLIGKWLNVVPDKCNKIKLVNRLVNGMVCALTFVKVLDYLRVGTGMAFESIFAIGTTGGLIISLASQEVAKGVVNNLMRLVFSTF